MSSFADNTSYKNAVRLQGVFPKKGAEMSVVLLGLFALISFALSFFVPLEPFLALSLLVLSFWFVAFVYLRFIEHLERDLDLSVDEVQNLIAKQDFLKLLTFGAVMVLQSSVKGDRFYPKDLFEALLSKNDFVWMLKRLGIDPGHFRNALKKYTGQETPLPLTDLLRVATQNALAGNHSLVRYPDILVGLYELDKVFQAILFEYDIEQDDLREVAYWLRRKQVAKGQDFFKGGGLRVRGIGKGWSGGFTVNLDRLGYDLTKSLALRKTLPNLYGRNKQVQLLSRFLLEGNKNALLVGEPGVGRHALLRAFVMLVNHGETFGSLRFKRVIQIDSGTIIGGTVSLNEVVGKIRTLFSEAARAGDVILVINNIDALFANDQEVGRVNATEALLPFLRSNLSIIGTITPWAYQATVEKDPQLVRVFSKLEIKEPTPAETLYILQDEVAKIEKRSGLFFLNASLKEIVKLTNSLIHNLPNPEKSLEILEDVAIFVASKTSDLKVSLKHIHKVVAQRTKIPVGQLEGKEKEKLLNMEQILHQRIVGQKEAINELADALRRARSGIGSGKRPIGSFLFLGPTGVGKTETSKALAAVYFGSESRMIRFDMSEFQEVRSISRLIGNPETGELGLLTEKVLADPFSLILFDELEKAHPRLLDLFLQVFDEGRLTDSSGRVIDFTNTMIISTSNAGAELIRQMVKSGADLAKQKPKILDHLQSKGIFRPEFLNRFDAVLLFQPLTDEELVEVAILLLKELNVRLKEKDVSVEITRELASAVVRGGANVEYGARPLRRYIQEKVENRIARGLIAGKIKRGDVVEIDLQSLERED